MVHVHAGGNVHPTGQVLADGMVPNPIYDGPMYESIHQEFSNVVQSPTSGDILLTPDNSLSPTSPHYVKNSTSNEGIAKNYENIKAVDSPSTLPESNPALISASSSDSVPSKSVASTSWY